jgi:Amt family ammonium transporter
MSNVDTLLIQVADLSQKLFALKGDVTDNVQRALQTQSWTVVSGDTAWMLASCALVLFMTMPGLAIYYGGMVSSKNVLAVAMQIFSITCLITVLWLSFGYSLAFTPVNWYQDTLNPNVDSQHASYPIYGNGSRLWLRGLTITSISQQAQSIPESVYCMFQLTFAIITPSLICGSFADRMKYWPMMLFMACWHTAVYCPLAHCMWHFDGILFNLGVADYAGGNVVHIASGVSGLVAALSKSLFISVNIEKLLNFIT